MSSHPAAAFSSVKTALYHAGEILKEVAASPRLDAFLLLGCVLGKDRAWLLAHPEFALTPPQSQQLQALLARRTRHEPMQYILGAQEFYGLRLKVTPAVLIPRPETEHLVEAVLKHVPHDRSVRIADVGTGSGSIAIALAHLLPHAEIDALDISSEALAVAEENARAHGVSQRVYFYQSDLLEAVRGGRYDVVASNPPYVATTETLEPQVSNWEPHLALFAGQDGLAVYRRLIPQIADVLVPGGLCALETGAGQQEALRDIFAASHVFSLPVSVPDLQGIARVMLAQREV